VEILRPKDSRDKVMGRLTAISKEFPEHVHDLLQILTSSKLGLSVSIQPYVPDRTRPQENYYRKWCREFGKFTGNTPDEVHEEMLCQCYGSEYSETRFGLRRRPVKRSGGANLNDFSELIETLIRVASQMGFVVPPPHRRASHEPTESESSSWDEIEGLRT